MAQIFNDDYYINMALRLISIHLDNLENNQGGSYSVKSEFVRIYKERTGQELSLNKNQYGLDVD